MIRIVVDIEPGSTDMLATKETVAMALERFGTVRVVAVQDPEAERKGRKW